MNTSETVPPHLLMQNVRDIRKRLMETEKTLNKITKAEAKVDSKYVLTAVYLSCFNFYNRCFVKT